MPRKVAASLDEARNEIKREYKRGARRTGEVIGDAALSAIEREMKQEIACYLKAQDFSHSYIGDAVGVSRSTVASWFTNPELRLMERVATIRKDFINGTVKLLKSYLIEIVESLMDIMRTTTDEKLAVDIGFQILDRVGLSKVNKSQSVSAITNREELEVTDRTGLLGRAKNAPPHVQAKMAEAMETMIALGKEYEDVDAVEEVVDV